MSSIFKIVCITDTGDQSTGCCGANPFQFHQPLAAVIRFCHAGQDPVIFSNVMFNAINVFQQVINTLLNLKRQRFLLFRYHVAQGICTVGYGDIVAVSWPARNATILVILTGYIYSLVFIARIVSGFSVSEK